MQKLIGAALTLTQLGEAAMRAEGLYDEYPEFAAARGSLEELALATGSTPAYAWNPGSWELCYHQASLALAGCWNGGFNTLISAIRGQIIDGLERHHTQQ